METPSIHPSSQQHPSHFIKPIKYRQNKPIDQENIAKCRIHHPKNLKRIHSPLSDLKDPSIRFMKDSAKILKKQDMISSTRYSIEKKTAFQNVCFSSNIRNMSTSLSSLELKSWDQINETRSKVIFRSLNSLKNLHDFQIKLVFCKNPPKSDLHSLFNPLKNFKKLSHFIFSALACDGFEGKHMTSLCSSLARSPQLQSLNLTFDGSDQFLEILIPALSKLTSLTKILLSLRRGRVLQAENIKKLFLTFSTLKHLTDITVRFASCPIAYKNTTIEPLAEGLQYLNASSITKLTLDPYDNVTEKGLVEISQALKRFTSIQSLDLTLPHSTTERLKQLSLTLRELTSLASLGFTFSGFTESLAEAFKYLQNLAHFRVYFINPNLSHNQIQLLSSSITSLKSSLKYLEIIFAWESSLSDSLMANLAEALKELTPLKHLTFSFPEASGVTSRAVETLSLAVQGLLNLSCLNLSFEYTKAIDEETMNFLSQALEVLPSLHSIALDLSSSDQITFEERDLQGFFAILCKMENLCSLDLKLPIFKDHPQELMKLKQRFTLRIYEIENFLQILAL